MAQTSAQIIDSLAKAKWGSTEELHKLLTDLLAPIGAVTAAAGAATLHALKGKVTTEALTTAGLAAYTLTLTNSDVAAADIVEASVANGTNSQGTVVLGRVTPAAGSAVILVQNVHASQALNGTLVVSYRVIKA